MLRTSENNKQSSFSAKYKLIMVEIMDAAEEHTRESVLELITKKDNIEREIAVLKGVLDSNSVGLSDSLVDGEGYPREDIDVYAVRHARHKIICLQNDHKNVMREIEVGLHHVHLSSDNRGVEEMDLTDKNIELPSAIARVDFISPESPAHISGLEVGDLIVQFGSVNDENYTSLQDINTVVKYSVGRKISITVLRNNSIVRLSLTPKLWIGRGLLGCNIVPIEAVDR